MKSILMSIQPKWVEKIISGEKTIEVRKTAPKAPFRAFIYCTKDKCGRIGKPYQNYEHIGIWGNDFRPPSFVEYGGKVVGEFVCDKVDTYIKMKLMYFIGNSDFDKTYLTDKEINDYGKGKDLFGLHITALKIYDKPRELGEFYSIKQCKPCKSPFGYQWTWEDRHKRNTGGWGNKYRPVPIECHRCKSLVGGKDYLDEKSGCVLFDYECISKHHKPLERPPQSWQYVWEMPKSCKENNND